MTVTDYLYHPQRDELVLLDIRNSEERRKGRYVAGSLHVPMDEILAGEEFGAPVDTPIVVLCERGGRAEIVTRYLQARGYRRVHKLEGGYRELGKYVRGGELTVAE